MFENTVDLVLGFGEVGKPIYNWIDDCGRVVKRIDPGKDLYELVDGECVGGMHVCFPYSSAFVSLVTQYIQTYEPVGAVIHSTVVPGTTRAIIASTGVMVAYSPVRGQHGLMERDLKRYKKFVAGPKMLLTYMDDVLCFDVYEFGSYEALELAKLVETTYSGVLIGFAQEVSRFCEALGVNYWEVMKIIHGKEHFPRSVFYPGHIGGHCIMQNLELLDQFRASNFAEAIRQSNALEKPDEGFTGKDRKRWTPRKIEDLF